MAAIVSSRFRSSPYGVSKGMFTVILANALLAYPEREARDRLWRRIYEMVGDYLHDCWPDRYPDLIALGMNAGVYLLDCESYSHEELLKLADALRAVARRMDTGEIALGATWDQSRHKDYAYRAREIEDIVRGAAAGIQSS